MGDVASAKFPMRRKTAAKMAQHGPFRTLGSLACPSPAAAPPGVLAGDPGLGGVRGGVLGGVSGRLDDGSRRLVTAACSLCCSFSSSCACCL